MSFELTKGKIEETRVNIKALQKPISILDYKSRFSATVNTLGSIWGTLRAEGKNKNGFEIWKEEKWKLIDSDPLLKSVYSWRNFDYHTGETNLIFGTQVPKGTIIVGKGEQTPIVIGPDGVYTIKNKDTADEERIPSDDIPHSVQIAIANPPESHLQNIITPGPPEKYLELAFEFYKNIVFEAINKF